MRAPPPRSERGNLYLPQSRKPDPRIMSYFLDHRLLFPSCSFFLGVPPVVPGHFLLLPASKIPLTLLTLRTHFAQTLLRHGSHYSSISENLAGSAIAITPVLRYRFVYNE